MCGLYTVGNYLIRPYLMPFPLTGGIYKTFLKEILPEMFDLVPPVIHCRMWFQHKRAPTHFHRNAPQYLNNAFSKRWMESNGPTAWPPSSPDMTPFDFFLWGYLKSLIYKTPVESEMDLVARMDIVAEGKIEENPRFFERVRQFV